MDTWKTLSVLVACLALLCAVPAPTSVALAQDIQEITYWFPWVGDSEEWTQVCIRNFEAAHPTIKIRPVHVPPDGGLEDGSLLEAIRSGAAPDLVSTSQATLGYALAAQGALEPLDEHLPKVGFDLDDVLVGFLDLMTYDGKVYVFPESTNVSMLFINETLAAAAGLDVDNYPTTIAELDAWTDALSKVCCTDGDFERLGFVPWIDGNAENPLLMGWMFGATFFDNAARQVTLAEQPLIDMFAWLKSYSRQYDPAMVNQLLGNVVNEGAGGAFTPYHPFFTGKVAMTINGNWFTNAIRLYAPDLKYRVVPIPAPPGGREKGSPLGTNAYIMPKGANHPEAALKFVMYMVSPEIRAYGADVWRDLSIWKESSELIKWVKDDDPIYQTILEIGASPNSGHPALTAIAGEIREKLIDIRRAVLDEGADPVPLLEQAQAELQMLVR